MVTRSWVWLGLGPNPHPSRRFFSAATPRRGRTACYEGAMPWLTTRRLVLAALAAWLAVAAIGLAIGPPLGHDEAAFAVTARGDQPVGAWLYRSAGTVAIGRLGVWLGGADWQLRLASAALGAGVVIAAFAVGRAAFTARTGAWAAALVAGAHPMALRSAQLLGDLPAAAAILGGIAVLVGELDRGSGRGSGLGGGLGRDPGSDLGSDPGRGLGSDLGSDLGSGLGSDLGRGLGSDLGSDLGSGLGSDAGPDLGLRWRIVAAAPLFAAAFYLRYASAPVIAIALVAAGLLWWRTVAARPVPALATLAALAALAVPHVVHSVHATGRVLGVLEISAGVPRRAYVGEGLVTYFTSNPLQFYGALIAPAMLAGLVALGRTRRRAPWYLAIVAVGQLVALGVHSHGQSRYVFVAAVLLAVIGVDAVARLRLPGAALALVAAAWLGAVATQVVVCRGAARGRASIVRTGSAIRVDARGRPCAAVAAAVPQVAWYTGCQVYVARLLEAPMPADRVRYAVALAHGPIDIDRVAAIHHLRAAPIATGDPDARLWRLE